MGRARGLRARHRVAIRVSRVVVEVEAQGARRRAVRPVRAAAAVLHRARRAAGRCRSVRMERWRRPKNATTGT